MRSEDAFDVDRLAPLVLDGYDVRSAPPSDVAHPLAEQPVTATTTTSPGWTTLTNAASMPAEPVAEIGSVRALSVPHVSRSI